MMQNKKVTSFFIINTTLKSSVKYFHKDVWLVTCNGQRIRKRNIINIIMIQATFLFLIIIILISLFQVTVFFLKIEMFTVDNVHHLGI